MARAAAAAGPYLAPAQAGLFRRLRWLAVPMALCFCGYLFAAAWFRIQKANRGYALNELRREQTALTQQIQQLEVEKVRLEAPARIRAWAEAHGMRPQSGRQIAQLEVPATLCR